MRLLRTQPRCRVRPHARGPSGRRRRLLQHGQVSSKQHFRSRQPCEAKRLLAVCAGEHWTSSVAYMLKRSCMLLHAEAMAGSADPDLAAAGPAAFGGSTISKAPEDNADDAAPFTQSAVKQALAAYEARVPWPSQATVQTLPDTCAAVAAATNAALREMVDANDGLQQLLRASSEKADCIERGLTRLSAFQLHEAEARALSETRREVQRLHGVLPQQEALLNTALEALAAAQSAVGACLGGPDQALLLVSPTEATGRLQGCCAAGADAVCKAGTILELVRRAGEVASARADLLDTARTRLRLVVSCAEGLPGICRHCVGGIPICVPPVPQWTLRPDDWRLVRMLLPVYRLEG